MDLPDSTGNGHIRLDDKRFYVIPPTRPEPLDLRSDFNQLLDALLGALARLPAVGANRVG